MLYEVKSKGGKTSYIYGTMHVIDAQYFNLQKKLVKTMLNAEQLCMEIPGVTSAGLSPDALKLKGKTLQYFFNTKQMDSLFVWAETNLLMNKGAFLDNFGEMQPFVIMQFLLQTALPDRTRSYEKEFERIAKQNKMPIAGLESIDEQLSIFSNMPDKIQTMMVMSTLRNMPKAKEEFEKMQSIYLSGDLLKLYETMKSEKDNPATSSRDLLENRNTKWVPKMIEMMRDKSVFFAVGAAHLPGPEGVLMLLEKAGCKVTPIKL